MSDPGRPRPTRRRGRWRRWLLTRGILVALIVVVLWATGCMERLFYYPEGGPTPPPAAFAGAESVRFQSADGTGLHGWFIPAPEAASGPRATILHLHGNAGNIESHLWFSEFFPEAGFNLFIFDYRGYGESEGRALRRNDLLADAEAALDAVLARADVDPQRIGLFGQSLGGAIGLNLMAGREEIAAGVILSSFTSWREIAASAVGGARPGPIARLVASVSIRDHRRPIDAIAAIRRPILIVHGDADDIVPVEHGRRLAAAGPTAELLILPGGDHNGLRATHPQAEEAPIAFFRRHLIEEAGSVPESPPD